MAENELSKNRLLYMYTRLTEGKTIYKKEAAQQFSCSLRSIQRDIDDLRAFFTNQSEINGIVQELEYDRKVDGYRLVPPTRNLLSNEEVFTVLKILLESRSLSKAELMPIFGKAGRLLRSSRRALRRTAAYRQ